MISQDNINYIIKVLKCDEPQIEPDWYEKLGFLFCHKIAGLFYNKSVTLGLKLPKKLDFILRDAFEKQKRSVVCKREYIKKISEVPSDNDFLSDRPMPFHNQAHTPHKREPSTPSLPRRAGFLPADRKSLPAP